MEKQPDNLTPVHEKMVGRPARELQMKQKAASFWFTGLSGSGKTTMALALEEYLHQQGKVVVLLDGDNVRCGLNRNLTFSEADRRENIRRIAEVNKLMIDNGIIVLNTFVSPLEEYRTLAREIIGENDFYLIWCAASLNDCETRDVKGLYLKARKGEIKDFTGISAPFEEPSNVFLSLDTGKADKSTNIDILVAKILPVISI